MVDEVLEREEAPVTRKFRELRDDLFSLYGEPDTKTENTITNQLLKLNREYSVDPEATEKKIAQLRVEHEGAAGIKYKAGQEEETGQNPIKRFIEIMLGLGEIHKGNQIGETIEPLARMYKNVENTYKVFDNEGVAFEEKIMDLLNPETRQGIKEVVKKKAEGILPDVITDRATQLFEDLAKVVENISEQISDKLPHNNIVDFARKSPVGEFTRKLLEKSYQHVPAPIKNVVEDMGDTLQDTAEKLTEGTSWAKYVTSDSRGRGRVH